MRKMRVSCVSLFVCWMIFHVCRADSCNGRCGQSLNPAYNCQCNTACERYNDCCSDYYAKCVEDSCSGRCGLSLDPAYNCQCNTACGQYGDCCGDYSSLCSGSSGDSGGSSSEGNNQLSGVMQDIWDADVNRLTSNDIIINTAGSRLFTYVNETKLSGSTYAAFMNLLDNYKHTIGQPEEVSLSEFEEIDTFLDEVLKTEVMIIASAYLSSKSLVEHTDTGLREALKELWFNLYPRSSSNNIYDSSGFEHVMVGELKGTKVSGFHSWLQFYLEEKAGNLRFTSMVSSAEPNMKGAAFTWYGQSKSKGSFFLGTSPEFDLAIYSICALQHTGARCNFDLEGSPVSIQTWDVDHKDGIQIGSAYPAI